MDMYDDMFEFVKNRLEQAPFQCVKSKMSINYSRFGHTERVFAWARRIAFELSPDVTLNKEVLFTAAIFHDVGYSTPDDNNIHAEAGAKICREYLAGKGFDRDFIEQVAYLVKNHTRKELLGASDTPIELILLLEADLLDDTAALGLVTDAMVVTKKRKPDFYKVYRHMLNYTDKDMKKNLMITEPGRRFWKEKQKLTEEFIRQLGRDLNLTEGI
jgi:uncharacterized protein